MHSLLVIGGGVLLLALCLIAGRLMGAALGRAALVFIPLWFFAAAVNLYVGVTKAGYSFAEEAPIFGLVFSPPALLALLLAWKLR